MTITVPNPLIVNIVPTPPGSVTLADGTLLPQRAATKIETTEAVPSGTHVTVPTANTGSAMPTKPLDGGTSAPVVAVNTVNKFLDPVFMLNVLVCLSGVVTAIIDVLPSSGAIDWRVTTPKLMLAVFGAVTSFLRQRTNTVTR